MALVALACMAEVEAAETRTPARTNAAPRIAGATNRVAVPNSAPATSPGPGAGAYAVYASGGGKGSPVRLATFPEVQADLELTPAQKEAVAVAAGKLKAFEAGLQEELKHPPAVAHGSAVERQWVASKYAQANQALAQTRLEIARSLSPAQMQRLEQIGLQELGADALFRGDIARSLNLTPAQQQALVRLRDGASSGRANVPTPAATNRPAGPAARPPVPGAKPASPATEQSATSGMTTWVSAETGRRMLDEVLTAQQRSKLRELQGRPIQLHSRSGP